MIIHHHYHTKTKLSCFYHETSATHTHAHANAHTLTILTGGAALKDEAAEKKMQEFRLKDQAKAKAKG